MDNNLSKVIYSGRPTVNSRRGSVGNVIAQQLEDAARTDLAIF